LRWNDFDLLETKQRQHQASLLLLRAQPLLLIGSFC